MTLFVGILGRSDKVRLCELNISLFIIIIVFGSYPVILINEIMSKKTKEF